MGGDAAIFGSGAVKHTLLLAAAATGGGDHPSRSHVARESAAFRLLPFAARSFPPPSRFALDPTPRKKKRKIQSETPREFGCD